MTMRSLTPAPMVVVLAKSNATVPELSDSPPLMVNVPATAGFRTLIVPVLMIEPRISAGPPLVLRPAARGPSSSR